MGLILDSSVLIAAERTGVNAIQSLRHIRQHLGQQSVAISTITLMEMAHGLARADSSARRDVRQRFLDDIVSVMTIQPVTTSIALRAGRIDGENKSRGAQVALSDLLIGVTALELGYGVATHNLRHFGMIREVNVVAF
jgi:predicted nucleic acid-binding protein